MKCEFCDKNQKDLYLLNLPCGFLVCSDHVISQDEMFICFVCNDHSINKTKCLEIRKNQKKIDQIKLLEEKNSILELCDKIDNLKTDPNCFFDNQFSSIINKIDLKKEILKLEFSKLVDAYHESLLKEVKCFQSDFLGLIGPKFKKINTENIRMILKACEDDPCFAFKKESDFNKNELDEFLVKLDFLKNFKFSPSSTKFDIELKKNFGTVNSKEILNDLKISLNLPLEKNLSLTESNEKNNLQLSNKFKFKYSFGMNYFVELNDGGIASSSINNSCNLTMAFPSTGQIIEIPAITSCSNIDFIFLANDKKIVTICKNGNAKIWQNSGCINSFSLSETKINFADLILNYLIFIDKTQRVITFNLENGRLEMFAYSIKEQITAFKILSNDIILTGHQDKVVEWNTKKQIKLREHQVYGTVNCIERISGKDFICATNICMVKVVNNELFFKNCSENHIISLQVCDNGNILTVHSLDETIKLWNTDNFDLVYQVTGSKPKFAKILKSGKLAYVDTFGKFYIIE